MKDEIYKIEYLYSNEDMFSNDTVLDIKINGNFIYPTQSYIFRYNDSIIQIDDYHSFEISQYGNNSYKLKVKLSKNDYKVENYRKYKIKYFLNGIS